MPSSTKMPPRKSNLGVKILGAGGVVVVLVLIRVFTGEGNGTGLFAKKVESTIDVKNLRRATKFDGVLEDMYVDWYYGTLHAKVAQGKRDDVLILCIHGENENSTWEHWRPNLGVLTKYGKVLMLSMPGFGESTLPLKRGSDPRARKKAIRRILDEEGITKVGDSRTLMVISKGLNLKPAIDFFLYTPKGPKATVDDLTDKLAGLVLISGGYLMRKEAYLLPDAHTLLLWSAWDATLPAKFSDKLMALFDPAKTDRVVFPNLATHDPETEDPILFESALDSWISARKVV
mmetsp:Transcript_9366/g.40688  ORF Transcript_9366/g.40688 Transcript_9366/m.40688 type:complete len:289 (-) Transcript_9366:247-1113(-)|eukprot:CAMPEP_0113957716 /NCGR_PEP_ID=MMETSP0011_2-20120614/2934_1 /TAXON_ID=101924 /ORGANISM="Rhodosorus marinus" /LENGTH=288 /DNA_ID=CAMNT_0000968329 /DNA_START=37 /DNA_END=903 /DNA_ORIENTATION=+ /assembly_acc=CAM_ASM_000156